MLKNKNIYKVKEKLLGDYTLDIENIGNYIRKYFNNDNYIIVQDSQKGWYNFKIGSRKYDDSINQINENYKIYLKEGYWYFDLVEKVE